MEYHKVGEIFEYDGVMLEVVEYNEYVEGDVIEPCHLCYFFNRCNELATYCGAGGREDRNYAYYKLVEQCETKDMEERKGDKAGVSGYEALPKKERVNHPDYYNSHPSGVECITIIRHHNFNIGSVIKYCWRSGLKTEEGMSDKDKQIEDLKKAIFYLNDEIKRLEEF